jgi:hypothetical protein
MAQELLHRLEVRAAHHQMVRKYVPQIVKATVGDPNHPVDPHECIGHVMSVPGLAEVCIDGYLLTTDMPGIAARISRASRLRSTIRRPSFFVRGSVAIAFRRLT